MAEPTRWLEAMELDDLWEATSKALRYAVTS